MGRAVAWSGRLRKSGLGGVVGVAKTLRVHRLVKRADERPWTYPPMDPEVEERLRHQFLPSIERLERLIDRDLSPWKPRKGT
jgi:hypothetical protein